MYVPESQYPVRYIIKKEKRKQNKKLECDADKELVKLRREKLHILQSWKWTQWDSDSCTTNVTRFHEQTISRLLIGPLPLNPKDPTDYFAPSAASHTPDTNAILIT